jgi:hypothetical protein
MDKQEAKKAYSEAENELKQKAIDKVKEFVKKTLEKLELLKKDEEVIKEKIRILKLDLDDLKEGRLDRIEERQQKDKEAEEVSVARVIKKVVVEHHYAPWYVPYVIEWKVPLAPLYPNTIYCSASSCSVSEGEGYTNGISVTNSIAKAYCAGTYIIGDHTVHFR